MNFIAREGNRRSFVVQNADCIRSSLRTLSAPSAATVWIALQLGARFATTQYQPMNNAQTCTNVRRFSKIKSKPRTAVTN